MSSLLTSYTYTLPSGTEIEVEGIEERKMGAAEVARRVDIKTPFESVIAPLGEMADLLFSKIKSAVNSPDSVSLEFAASLKGQTKLLIVNGEGTGSIKVTLSWKKDK